LSPRPLHIGTSDAEGKVHLDFTYLWGREEDWFSLGNWFGRELEFQLRKAKEPERTFTLEFRKEGYVARYLGFRARDLELIKHRNYVDLGRIYLGKQNGDKPQAE